MTALLYIVHISDWMSRNSIRTSGRAFKLSNTIL